MTSIVNNNSPPEGGRKKLLVAKKVKSKGDVLSTTLNKDFEDTMMFLEENEVGDDLDSDIVTFYVQQVLRLGRKSHATVEVDMDKNVVNIFKARSDKERRTGDESAKIFLRPETAQGIFVNYLNVQSSMRQKLPFGIAQVGKAFRNVSPIARISSVAIICRLDVMRKRGG